LTSLTSWSCGHAARGFNPDPADDSHWEQIYNLYTDLYGKRLTKEALTPFQRVIEIVRDGGCRTVVAELNYIDLDYRSEYSAFWSRLFADKPTQVPRIHFFSEAFGPEQIHDVPNRESYLGYSVLRPTELGPVGRTLLSPPPWARKAKLTTVRTEPTFFGTPLPLTGTPFYQQDGQLMRCAHVVAWIAQYAAASFAGVQRVPSGQIALLPPAVVSRYRPLPASGLTMEQLQYLLTSLDLPALFYEVNDLVPIPGSRRNRHGRLRGAGPPARARRWARRDYRERIMRVACKYLNSGLPVIVLTANQHAFTLVGWERLADDSVRLLACDDQLGPYIEVDPVEPGHCGAWESLMVPAPEKVLLAGEAAERRALDMLAAFTNRSLDPGEQEVARLIGQVRPTGKGSVRARLMEGTAYKAALRERGLPDDHVRLFRLADLSHWVWVVELHERAARSAGEPCVRAEVVFDSTSHDDDPSAHLVLTPAQALDVAVYKRSLAEDEGSTPLEGLVERQVEPWSSIIAEA
jgi:hypothetical protein